MSKFLINLLVQISNALVYSKKKFYSKRNFLQLSAQWPAGPSDLFGPEQPGKPSRPARPCPPSSLPHRVGSAAASSRAAAVPWTPPLLLPCHGAATVAPLTPPSSIGYNSPPLHSGNGSHEGANYRHRSPFLAAPPLSQPYKRVPALRWSTTPLHLASFPPQSCPRRGCLELKLRCRCAASSPSLELR
jgi:hypothetical protein